MPDDCDVETARREYLFTQRVRRIAEINKTNQFVEHKAVNKQDLAEQPKYIFPAPVKNQRRKNARNKSN
jgi:hypothetical protein